MAENYFDFKQFRIVQGEIGMRLSTDSVLLGAAVASHMPGTILDIGSGSGILSLMMAQYFPNAEITAIEIDSNAFAYTKQNVQNSPWKNRITCVHNDFRLWQTDNKFDLLISNPPYFENDTLSPEKDKQIARQNTHLSYSELVFAAQKIMHSKSEFWCIVPYLKKDLLISAFMKYRMAPFYFMNIKSSPHKNFIRIILGFSPEIRKVRVDELSIYNEKNEYSDYFKELTKDFYIKT